MRYKKKVVPLTLTLLTACSVNAFAVPPPEAFTACEGKNSGDKAELTLRQGRSVPGHVRRKTDGLYSVLIILKDREVLLRTDHPRHIRPARVSKSAMPSKWLLQTDGQ